MSRGLIALIIAAAACIAGQLAEFHWLVYVAKPAAIAICFGIAFAASPTPSARYRTLILIGLAWSALGDVLLMLPQDRFVLGLASFLVAHLFYIAAFWGERGRPVIAPMMLVPLVGMGTLVFAMIRSGLPSGLLIPIGAYLIVILAMALLATSRAAARRTAGARAAGMGAMCFVASDALLAINRFDRPLPIASLWILGTYFAAQYAIARSVRAD
ncbi:MAG: lysoplasmalogenase [Gemmatimonadaceae bacterium]|nr:lysoplasmalogenase [Gemmatimonadaceae bacterium]